MLIYFNNQLTNCRIKIQLVCLFASFTAIERRTANGGHYGHFGKHGSHWGGRYGGHRKHHANHLNKNFGGWSKGGHGSRGGFYGSAGHGGNLVKSIGGATWGHNRGGGGERSWSYDKAWGKAGHFGLSGSQHGRYNRGGHHGGWSGYGHGKHGHLNSGSHGGFGGYFKGGHG